MRARISTIDSFILSKLPDAKRKGKQWTARCPAHDDRRASLSIGVGDDGRVLVHCHAGCTPEAVVAALGLKFADLMPANSEKTGRSTKPRPTPKAGRPKKENREVYATAQDAIAELERRHGPRSRTWTYYDANGNVAGVVVRWDARTGKDILPVSKTAEGWVIGGMAEPRPLYRLPELLSRSRERVYVCEGEKAADAAASIGLLATCSAHGSQSAAKTDWQPLAGRDVVLLPDHDAAGEKYAADARHILLNQDPPAKVRIVPLPGLAEHGDIFDFVEEHDTVEPEALRTWILDLVEKTEPEKKHDGEQTLIRPIFVRMEDVEAKPIHWLWQDRIPAAMLSLLVGIEGTGKTFVGLDMAARITAGRPWPDAQGPQDAPTPGNVIILTSEDHLEFTIRPRLNAMQADPARIVALKGVTGPAGDEFFDVLRHLPALETLTRNVGDVRLVLIDPLTAFLGATDQNRNGEVRTALARLSDLAERYGCAIVGISHLSKDTGKQAIHRTIGSVAFSATARAVWLVSEDKQDSERRLLVPVKMNLGPMAKSLAFRVKDMAVIWEAGQFDYAADDVLTALDANQRTAIDEAVEWLRSLLADGRMQSKEIRRLARQEGITAETLKRARSKLGVVAEKEGIGSMSVWYCSLPAAGGAK